MDIPKDLFADWSWKSLEFLDTYQIIPHIICFCQPFLTLKHLSYVILLLTSPSKTNSSLLRSSVLNGLNGKTVNCTVSVIAADASKDDQKPLNTALSILTCTDIAALVSNTNTADCFWTEALMLFFHFSLHWHQGTLLAPHRQFLFSKFLISSMSSLSSSYIIWLLWSRVVLLPYFRTLATKVLAQMRKLAAWPSQALKWLKISISSFYYF